MKILAEENDEDSIGAAIHRESFVSEAMLQLQNIGLSRENRRMRNKKFIRALKKSQSHPKGFQWLKQRLNNETGRSILDDYLHKGTWLQNLVDNASDIMKRVRKTLFPAKKEERYVVAFFKRVVHITVAYLDLVKDVTLLAQIILVVGFTDSGLGFPEMVICLLASFIS